MTSAFAPSSSFMGAPTQAAMEPVQIVDRVIVESGTFKSTKMVPYRTADFDQASTTP